MDAEQLAYMRQHNLSWKDLYDFPMSWDWWRHYSVYHTGVDPGPDQPPEEASLSELKERLEHLENLVSGLSPEDLKRLTLKDLSDRMRGLERGLALTQRVLAGSIRSRTRPKKKSSKGVPL